MSTLGPNNAPLRPARSSAHVLIPVPTEYEFGKAIMENFNSIQLGDQRKLGILGTQELDESRRQMVELLAYSLVLSGTHVMTSGGGTGINLAVIKGALRANKPELLTVLLPQSLSMQPPPMRHLLAQVSNLIEQPQNDDLDLKIAANMCNYQLMQEVERVLVFVYHASYTILDNVNALQRDKEIVKFYLD
ncbi:DNA recombination-mediator protein A [archaeon]|nr:MAG: DNA recombination-mediator protein A [archaeon]